MDGSPRLQKDAERSPDRIKLLVVDDNTTFIDSINLLLGMENSIAVVGRAASGEEAIELVRSLKPDLVLMDVTMPGMGGLEATRRIKGWIDAPLVIVLTLYNGVDYQAATAASGADRFMSKSDVGLELVPAIYELCGRAPREQQDPLSSKAVPPLSRHEGDGK